MRASSILLIALATTTLTRVRASNVTQELKTSECQPGVSGGRLVVGLRAEPRTLNPIVALDAASREIISLLTADLIQIDRSSLKPVSALAKSWTTSNGGKEYTLHLRRGLRFSDGYPFNADDVMFTFRAHLDERVHSPQREILSVGGQPITLHEIDSYTVVFDLAQPYAGAERLFDGIGILPKHLLGNAYASGEIASAWGVSALPAQVAGLGPFRLKDSVPGQMIVLERNPYYWKVDSGGNHLPYLDEIVFLFVGSEDGQVLRFQSGETQAIAGLSADSFVVLRKKESPGFQLFDVGPGLEYSFLLLNLNVLNPNSDSPIRAKQAWFRDVGFRQALSSAIDRDSIVRLVYRGMASPLWTHVTEGNRVWLNRQVAHPSKSLSHARQLLETAGFSWNPAGQLLDRSKKEVGFSILTSSGNSQRTQIAVLVQQDLKELGLNVSIVSLEFRAMLDRVFQSHQYEAAVMTLASGDIDPNSEMNVLVSKGSTRLWNLDEAATTDWEQEIDSLMRKQMITLDFAKRKQYYDRVQELVFLNLPMIYLVNPHLLVGAADRLGNFHPSILSPYILWNADQLYFQSNSASGRVH
jgi:peptide/nickel transport system substrate-binding protein